MAGSAADDRVVLRAKVFSAGALAGFEIVRLLVQSRCDRVHCPSGKHIVPKVQKEGQQAA
jgi:hypothetical protein